MLIDIVPQHDSLRAEKSTGFELGSMSPVMLNQACCLFGWTFFLWPRLSSDLTEVH